MSVFRDKWAGYDGSTWRVVCYYTDWQGKKHRHEKRGFETKREAIAHEQEFLFRKTQDVTMLFSEFLELYFQDLKPQIKPSTLENKETLINKHIRPYFEKRRLSDISPGDVLQWRNELLCKRDDQGKGYTPTYLRTIDNQINAIFNHAVKYYGLSKNPCLSGKKMGKSKASEMDYWTKEEYLRFAEAIKDKPMSYYAFQLLFWTGIRCGELLALTKADFDLKKKTLRINKNYQIVKGEEMILTPKSDKSNRMIILPDFLCREMEDYFESIYKLQDDARLFEVTKYFLHHEMERGCKKTGVKEIRIHDLRHSHCALLISLGYSPIQIAERMGHESVTITERYSHLYPTVQQEMATKLDVEFAEGEK